MAKMPNSSSDSEEIGSLGDMLKFYALGQPLALRLKGIFAPSQPTKPCSSRASQGGHKLDKDGTFSSPEINMAGQERPCTSSGASHGSDIEFWLSSSSFWQHQQQYVPSAFICPLSQGIMREPVHARDGITYDKAAIQAWFKQGHVLSPVTKAPISHPGLLPNDRMRRAIQQWRVLFALPQT